MVFRFLSHSWCDKVFAKLNFGARTSFKNEQLKILHYCIHFEFLNAWLID